MNREHWKAMLPTITAFVEGRTIQGRLPGIPWEDINDKHVVSFQGGEYRIKPTPTLRPWKPDEVPVGAVVRNQHRTRQVIVGVSYDGLVSLGSQSTRIDLPMLLAEYQLDDGSPCGVEVTE